MTKKKCPHCGRDYVWSSELQKASEQGMKDAGNCVIPDGWYCPVCDY